MEESHKEIGRTLTHEMYIKGSGFAKVFPPILVFEPHIDKEDFAVQVGEDDLRYRGVVILPGMYSANGGNCRWSMRVTSHGL